MIFTSARSATVIELVDTDNTDFDLAPIPAVNDVQIFDQYHPAGGQTRYVPTGGARQAITPTATYICQVDDATARAVLAQFRQLARDKTEQPFAVQWDDDIPGGPDDGLWWVFSLAAAEVSSDYPGWISLQISMALATAADDTTTSTRVLGPDGSVVATLDIGRVWVG